jgi:3-methyladenine DNA glycosylase/8-oxoguanine DNA glycosylase
VALRTRPLPYDAGAAIRHIGRRDPIMRGIVRACGPFELRRRGTPFQSLMRALLYQQLAGAAAAAIERRFLALYGGRAPSARELLQTTPEALRSAGLSRQKSSYLHSLAEHFESGAVTDRRLARMPDEDVIAAVTEIKGIGPWTAHMLLLFSLGRPDVLPVGDYGVRKAMMLSYSLSDLPDPKTMERIGEPWRPYRSAAAWYLWRTLDTLTL